MYFPDLQIIYKAAAIPLFLCQFQQFQALTQARLDMLALNQNRNTSWQLESHIHTLNDHYHHMSQDLEHLRQSTTQEIESLRLELGHKWSLHGLKHKRLVCVFCLCFPPKGVVKKSRKWREDGERQFEEARKFMEVQGQEKSLMLFTYCKLFALT